VRDDIDINAAHNKVKNGLAVRSRDDNLLTFTTNPPNPDGNFSPSALTGENAVDIFNSPTLDYLARPKSTGRKQGLEVTSLALTPSILLAESWMMSVTYGAMFQVAASRHFQGRDVSFMTYPALPLAPTPEQLLGESVVGMRRPVTYPPDGGELDRKAGIAFQTTFTTCGRPSGRSSWTPERNCCRRCEGRRVLSDGGPAGRLAPPFRWRSYRPPAAGPAGA
jgi:hypothetical protein